MPLTLVEFYAVAVAFLTLFSVLQARILEKQVADGWVAGPTARGLLDLVAGLSRRPLLFLVPAAVLATVGGALVVSGARAGHLAVFAAFGLLWGLLYVTLVARAVRRGGGVGPGPSPLRRYRPAVALAGGTIAAVGVLVAWFLDPSVRAIPGWPLLAPLIFAQCAFIAWVSRSTEAR